MEKMIYVLLVGRGHGTTNFSAHVKYEAAFDKLETYVRDNWVDWVNRGRLPAERPEDANEAVGLYFDATVGYESYSIEDVPLDTAELLDAPTLTVSFDNTASEIFVATAEIWENRALDVTLNDGVTHKLWMLEEGHNSVPVDFVEDPTVHGSTEPGPLVYLSFWGDDQANDLPEELAEIEVKRIRHIKVY